MKKVERKDIVDQASYEQVREQARRRVIDLKKRRRVALGTQVSVLFENRDTVTSQIQEMMRTEHISDEEKILHEIETYNQILPEEGEVSATLFIEITDQDRIQEEMNRYRRIDSGETLYLQIGERKIYAKFDTGRSNEEKLSAVHYVRFPLRELLALKGGFSSFSNYFKKETVRLALNHPGSSGAAVLSPELKEELLRDLNPSSS